MGLVYPAFLGAIAYKLLEKSISEPVQIPSVAICSAVVIHYAVDYAYTVTYSSNGKYNLAAAIFDFLIIGSLFVAGNSVWDSNVIEIQWLFPAMVFTKIFTLAWDWFVFKEFQRFKWDVGFGTAYLVCALAFFPYIGVPTGTASLLQLRPPIFILPFILICLDATFYARHIYKRRKRRQTEQSNPSPAIGPASPDEIKTVVELDQQYFHPADIVSEEVFRTWQCKNNSVFTVIRSDEGVAGYYAVLPLTTKALDSLVRGSLIHKDIKSKHILSKKKASKPEALYLFSIVMKNRYSKSTSLLLRHLENYLKSLYGSGSLKKIYAIGATPEGEHLLRRYNFQKIREGVERADGHSLYLKDLLK